ncbi:MAG: phosphoglycerate kinase [Gammaproteobacteria bacterium]|nr:phosphoglycerate kinase [Gammaproteobacteria bacterium]|tara:strand:+ start:6565 stop:7725 length:1161 start_codon:yes stop_codon:yes gene_type:complete
MLKSINNHEVTNKTILLRLDLNVPISNSVIQSTFRIKQTIPTIDHLLRKNNKIIILSHLGRPEEGIKTKSFSLKPIATVLEKILNTNIGFAENWIDGVNFSQNKVVLCENVRFEIGEKSNNDNLSKKIAKLADIFVFDAFGVAHRKECTTFGISNFLDTYSGLLVDNEIQIIKKTIKNPTKPLLTIVSGAKITTKLKLLQKLLEQTDHMILGGGILNTFLCAMDYEIGKSLYEKSSINEAKKILNSSNYNKIILPTDVICASSDSYHDSQNKSLSMIQSDDRIFDIGTKTVETYKQYIESSGTVFWNGPLGFIEQPPFDKGTKEISKIISNSNCFSLVGGGDTVSLIEKINLENEFSYISTGGGSLLKWIEGEKLPILEKLGAYDL